jgi:hypothetical protein
MDQEKKKELRQAITQAIAAWQIVGGHEKMVEIGESTHIDSYAYGRAVGRAEVRSEVLRRIIDSLPWEGGDE